MARALICALKGQKSLIEKKYYQHWAMNITFNLIIKWHLLVKIVDITKHEFQRAKQQQQK